MVLKDALHWTPNLGVPGFATPAYMEVFNSFLIPKMVQRVLKGQSSPEDAALAASLAGSVSGVNYVTNRLIAPVVAVESSESLINRGVTFLDAGDYPSAIDCFRKAFADPNNKGVKELLDRAQRAQQTEEELLKNRQ